MSWIHLVLPSFYFSITVSPNKNCHIFSYLRIFLKKKWTILVASCEVPIIFKVCLCECVCVGVWVWVWVWECVCMWVSMCEIEQIYALGGKDNHINHNQIPFQTTYCYGQNISLHILLRTKHSLLLNKKTERNKH